MDNDIKLENMQVKDDEIKLELGEFPFLKGTPGNGIQKIEKTDSAGLIDTYTITYTDETTTTYTITNGENGLDGTDGQVGATGNGILKIEKTNTIGLIDTYTITYTDETITTFEIKNGKDGQEVEFIVVSELPTQGKTGAIYLKLKENQSENNIYDEYIYTKNSWEKIGTTDIDLSNYYTIEQVKQLLTNYAKKTDIPKVIDNLNTDDSLNSLSAKQGKILDEKKANIEQAVVVSSTEPQTSEKVWFQKSKNLFKDDFIPKPLTRINTGVLKKGTYTFTIKDEPTFPRPIYIKLHKDNGVAIEEGGHLSSSNVSVTFSNSSKTYYTSGSFKFLTFTIDDNYQLEIGMADSNNTVRAMLEPGSVATQYEPYIPKKILTKSNGVFEEFYNEEEVITNKNGTAIKLGNGTMICTNTIYKGNVDISNAWGNFYESTEAVDLGFFAQPFANIPVITLSSTKVGNSVTVFPEIVEDKSNSRAGYVYVNRPMKSGIVEVALEYIAVGRWK